MPSWRRSKSGHVKNLNSIMRENCEEFISLSLTTRNSKRPSRVLARNWTNLWLPLCLAKISKNNQNCGNGESNKVISKFMCISEASESTRLRMGESSPNHHEDILQEKETIHCSITSWYINLFLCLKRWRYPQQRQQWTRIGKIGEIFGVEPDESQK